METQRARRRVVLACLGVLVGVAVTDAAFGCSELATAVEVDLRFDRRFQGTYRPGEPYDVLTVLPNGGGETLAEVGITLRVRFVCNEPGNVTPIVGLPWQEIVLYSPTIGSCTWMYAARSTDANGWTEFVGTFRAGGCTENLLLFADGLYMATIPIRLNSPDTTSASPLVVDQSDLVVLVARLGVPAQYSICFDYNEDGAVDASDLAYFATGLGAACE